MVHFGGANVRRGRKQRAPRPSYLSLPVHSVRIEQVESFRCVCARSQVVVQMVTARQLTSLLFMWSSFIVHIYVPESAIAIYLSIYLYIYRDALFDSLGVEYYSAPHRTGRTSPRLLSTPRARRSPSTRRKLMSHARLARSNFQAPHHVPHTRARAQAT
jgi:hypothetical protein